MLPVFYAFIFFCLFYTALKLQHCIGYETKNVKGLTVSKPEHLQKLISIYY